MKKACPVVLRTSARTGTEILAFRHPLAGCQLIKGGVQAGEKLADACRRELREESGISAAPTQYIGSWQTGYEAQVWGFYLMDSREQIADFFTFYCHDDGGHLFSFFWQALDESLGADWHPLFANAVKFLIDTPLITAQSH